MKKSMGTVAIEPQSRNPEVPVSYGTGSDFETGRTRCASEVPPERVNDPSCSSICSWARLRAARASQRARRLTIGRESQLETMLVPSDQTIGATDARE